MTIKKMIFNSNNLSKNLINDKNIAHSNIKYDDFMSSLVGKIKSNRDIDAITDEIMDMISNDKLEQIYGNQYKYKDFYILELFRKDGIDYSNKLKTLDKLNLSMTQKYVETIEKDGTVYIITQIPGTETNNLRSIMKFGINDISNEDKLLVYEDFQKLTKAGYIDDRVLASKEYWYVNSDNKIIIPNFSNLRQIRADESHSEILTKYYNILFK